MDRESLDRMLDSHHAPHPTQSPPPSQDARIDQISDDHGPADSEAGAAMPRELMSPAEVAHSAEVAQQIAALEDPAQRAEAQRLLQVIRAESTAKEKSQERSQEAELEP